MCTRIDLFSFVYIKWLVIPVSAFWYKTNFFEFVTDVFPCQFFSGSSCPPSFKLIIGKIPYMSFKISYYRPVSFLNFLSQSSLVYDDQ